MSGAAESAAIAQHPSPGRASMFSQGIIYVSRPGYVGADSFISTRHGRDKSGGRIVKTIRVAMTVRPTTGSRH
jgi:hypothetical protein